jgi:hypothetical protein
MWFYHNMLRSRYGVEQASAPRADGGSLKANLELGYIRLRNWETSTRTVTRGTLLATPGNKGKEAFVESK